MSAAVVLEVNDVSLALQGNLAVDPPRLLTDEEIRTQLERLRLRAAFETPGQDHDFLAYVVGKALSSRTDCTEAGSTASDVLGRNDCAQSDPAVRIEAGRVFRTTVWQVQ